MSEISHRRPSKMYSDISSIQMTFSRFKIFGDFIYVPKSLTVVRVKCIFGYFVFPIDFLSVCLHFRISSLPDSTSLFLQMHCLFFLFVEISQFKKFDKCGFVTFPIADRISVENTYSWILFTFRNLSPSE